MRVSKTVREYIYKQVNAKMEKKYAAALEEETAMRCAVDDFHSTMLDAIGNLMDSMTVAEVEKHPFLRAIDKDFRRSLHYGLSHTVEVIPTGEPSVRRQMEKEAGDIVENIIVTLELGGTKADLERMLADIEVEG